MSNRIVNLQAHPVLALVGASLFGCSHWLINRQFRKMVVLNVLISFGLLSCVLPGVLLLALSCFEAYKSASKLMTGQTLHPNGYTLWLCYRVASVVDRRAVYEGSPTPLIS
jgi:hypothetical protein